MKHAFEFSGFGVFASIDLSSGDFLLEYVGEKIVHVPACSVLWFNLFSSQNPKAQVSVSNEICPSSLCQTFHSFVFFSRITGPILTKLGIKHSWMDKGDLNLFKWGAMLKVVWDTLQYFQGWQDSKKWLQPWF